MIVQLYGNSKNFKLLLVLLFFITFAMVSNTISFNNSDNKNNLGKKGFLAHKTFLRSHSCIVKYINLDGYQTSMQLNNMDSFTVVLRGPWDKDFVEILFNGTREIRYLNAVVDSIKRRRVSYDILSQSSDTIIGFYTDIDNLNMSLKDRLILLNINGFCVIGIFPVTPMILIEYGQDKRQCIADNFVDTVYVYFYQGDLILFYQNYRDISRLSKVYGN